MNNIIWFSKEDDFKEEMLKHGILFKVSFLLNITLSVLYLFYKIR